MGKGKFFERLKYFDMFGIPIQLNLDRRPQYKSIFGALISIIMRIAGLYFLIKLLISWFLLEVSTVVYSSENESIISMINNNRSSDFILDYKNYYLYFSVWAELDDQSQLSYKDLSKYINIGYQYSFSSYDSDFINIESEDCNVRKSNDFLNLDYNVNEIPENQTNYWRMCVKNPLKMGLFPHLKNSDVYVPVLKFEIQQCRNISSEKVCASIEEIEKMIKKIKVQASIPKAVYDFKNQSAPIHRTYKYEYYDLDWGLSKNLNYEINPTFLYKDFGLINDDYVLDNINFNPGQQTVDFNTKDLENVALFRYKIYISFQKDKFYIRNQKLNDIIGSFGGLTSVIFSIASYFCLNLNQYLYINTLLNFAFKFNMKSSKKVKKIFTKKSDSIQCDEHSRITFFKSVMSFFKFKFRKEEDEIFLKSKRLLNEYIDIKKMISKFQEIDKLKMIMLSKSQRFFFDLIPKPDISNENDKNLSAKDTLHKAKLKKITNKDIKENYENISKNVQDVDNRIFSLLNPKDLNGFNLEFVTKVNTISEKAAESMRFKD